MKEITQPSSSQAAQVIRNRVNEPDLKVHLVAFAERKSQSDGRVAVAPGELPCEAHDEVQGKRVEGTVAGVEDGFVIGWARVGRSFILRSHDSVGEQDAGNELEDEDPSPSEYLGVSDPGVVLSGLGLTSRLEVFSRTKS